MQVYNYRLGGIGPSVQLGKGGLNLSDVGGILTITKGGTLVNARIAAPVVSDDAVNFGTLTQQVTRIDGVTGFTAGYSPNTNAHYISGATSLRSADNMLDAAIFALSGEADDLGDRIDLVEGIVGIVGGVLVLPTNTHMNGQTTVTGALGALDGAIVASDQKIDRVIAAEGLSSLGNYIPHTASHYLNSSVTAREADELLDEAIYANQVNLATTANLLGLSNWTMPDLSQTNYLDSATSAFNALVLLDQTTKSISDAVDGLLNGGAMIYMGEVSGGPQATPTDLDALAGVQGAFYRVSQSGYFVSGSTTYYANEGDNFIKNGSGGWDHIDNSSPSVQGTTGRIRVTGDEDTGYIIDISPTYTGQTSITTLGVVTTGEWKGTVIESAYGGTGFGSYVQGDMLVGALNGTLMKLSRGVAGSALMMNSAGTAQEWRAILSSDVGHNMTTVGAAIDANAALISTVINAAGLSSTGTYVADPASNYLKTATSLYHADTLLDARLYELSQEVDSMTQDRIISDDTKFVLAALDTGLSASYDGSEFLKINTVANGSLLTISHEAARVKITTDKIALDGGLDMLDHKIENLSTAVDVKDALPFGQAKQTFETIHQYTVNEVATPISLGAIDGEVNRVTIKIISPFDITADPSLGITGDVDALVGSTDIDANLEALFVIEQMTTIQGDLTWVNNTTGTGVAEVTIHMKDNS